MYLHLLVLLGLSNYTEDSTSTAHRHGTAAAQMPHRNSPLTSFQHQSFR